MGVGGWSLVLVRPGPNPLLGPWAPVMNATTIIERVAKAQKR